MTSIISAKAISLASTPGAVEERPHARVFRVRGTSGNVHHVIVGARPIGAALTTAGTDVCTCQAGSRGGKCSHMAAAHLVIARERRGEAEARSPGSVDNLAPGGGAA